MTVRLRARTGWESIDLGFRMAAAWWRPVWAVWCAVYLPTALAVYMALRDHPFVAALVLWWSKPLFDRFVLHVLAQSVFGATPRLVETLGQWKRILAPGLVAALTWRRPFDWSRSFGMSVAQLERQRGAAASRRRGVLAQRFRGEAMALTFVCWLFEWLVLLGLVSLLAFWFRPEESPFMGPDGTSPISTWWTGGYTLVYIAAVTVIEPFYVAAGFALYLSRRVALEGWDIELSFRRLSARLTAGGALLMLCVCVLGDLGSHTRAAEAPVQHANQWRKTISEEEAKAAVPLDGEARRTIVRVLSNPKYGGYADELVWRARNSKKDKPEDAKGPVGNVGAMKDAYYLLSGTLQFLGWLLLAAIIIVLLWGIARRWAPVERAAAAESAPQVLFGLQIAPASLPDDIAASALAHLAAGRLEDALSLVYRGALSYLVHDRKLKIAAGATEGDVARLAARALVAEGRRYFDALLSAWIAAAYADRLPDAERIRALCQEYPKHFQSSGGNDPAAVAVPP